MLVRIGLAVVVGVIAGCATVESGQAFNTSAEARLKIGETTAADAVAWFGQPLQVTRMSDGGTLMVYTHIVSRGNLAGHAESKSETLGLNFGPDGKLRKFVTSAMPSVSK